MKPLHAETASIEEIVEAFETKRPILGIKTIGTHPRIHADEIAGVAILRKYGRGIFLCIEKSDVMIVTQEWIRSEFGEDDLAWARMIQKGILVVGTGGGPLDDHVQRSPSSLLLVARFLGVDKNRELQKLITYINYEDSHGERGGLAFENEEGSTPLHEAVKEFLFATRVKHTWDVCPENAIEAFTKYFICEVEMAIDYTKKKLDVTNEILSAVTYVELPFATTKKDDVAEFAVTKSQSKLALSVILEGNNRPNLVAILQIEDSGNFQIHTVGRRIGLKDVVHMIRGKILKVKNEKDPKNQVRVDWKKIGEDGLFSPVPEIYYYRSNQTERIFNGSSSQPNTSPTIGTFFTEEQLVRMVSVGLQDKMFDREHQKSCKQGKCLAQVNNTSCSLYRFGLKRCRTNRFNSLPKEEGSTTTSPQ